MPSAIMKPQENGAPVVQETSIQAAIAIIEKKVRNLEKRKGKLDSYREILGSGKPLNEDQQAAVERYDAVACRLEYTKELMDQFGKLAKDEAKDKRKMVAREQHEQAQEELRKVAYVLGVKEVLSTLQEDQVMADLKSGGGGAPKLTADQLSQLQQFSALVTPDRDVKENGSFDKQVNASADHLLSLAKKKTRAVVGTTYQDLHLLIQTIRESGFIEAKWSRDSATNTEAGDNGEEEYDTQDTQEDDDDEMPATETVEKPMMSNGHAASVTHDQRTPTPQQQQPQPMSVFPNQQQQQQMTKQQHQAPQQQQIPAVPQPQQQHPQQQALSSFNFLQESQIDLESPHMDPAVVMVHPAKRPLHQAHPPGMPAGYVDQSRQMLQQLHIQQEQQKQAFLAHQQPQQQQQSKFSSSQHSAFEAGPGITNGVSAPHNGAQPFTQQQQQQSTPTNDRQGPSTDPRAPRVPDGTPQHVEPSPSKSPVYNPPSAQPSQPSKPVGYAAAAGGSSDKQPDTEIGTWKPEAGEGGEDGDKGRRGRGGGGRGYGGRGNNRGYTRGRGDRDRGERGDRGDRGDRGERGDRTDRADRGERGGYRGDRRGGDRRQYDDRDRRDDRPRGSGGRGGGYRGRGGQGGPRGGGQNGHRE